MEPRPSLPTACLAGALAGLSVDVVLFPVDTIKTRMQSREGFIRAGAFKSIYSGLGSTAVGSLPAAGMFFLTYEGIKKVLSSFNFTGSQMALVAPMAAAAGGEVAACLTRLPTEIVKQRAQVSKQASHKVFLNIARQEGLKGFYRGYFSMVMREIPFSLIQFPIWETFKNQWQGMQGDRPLEAWQSGICGAGAGAISATLTCPLDVAKTRIMLAEKGSQLAKGHIVYAMKVVYKEKGIVGLFAGVKPRVCLISIGGFIFLGVYDKMKSVISNVVDR